MKKTTNNHNMKVDDGFHSIFTNDVFLGKSSLAEEIGNKELEGSGEGDHPNCGTWQ